MPKIIEDEDVFRAVMQTIVKRGYAGATTREMADAAHVSEVTLFRKYENKKRLVKLAIAALVEQTDFAAATQYTGDLQTDLLNILAAYQAAVVEHGPFFAVLFAEYARYPDLIESFDEPLSLFYSIGQLMARYQAEGRLRQEHPLHAVVALLGPLMYSGLMRSTIPESQLPPLDLPQHVAFYLDGRTNRSATE